MKFYIAGPFFNEAQIAKVEYIKCILQSLDIEFFSPKDDCLFKPEGGHKMAKNILNANISAIFKCDAMIVITDGKDTGTMFEAGFAYANEVPLLYVWLDHAPHHKFNLMLGASGAVAMNEAELLFHLRFFIDNDYFDPDSNIGVSYE